MRKVNPVTALIRMSVAAMLVMAACCASAQIKIPASNTINTVAGAGLYAGDGGAATSARLNAPAGLAMDSAGNIYIADIVNNCVRKVTAAGVITTIAGGPAGGYGGDGGPASLAQLEQPQGVALDGSGNLYIADWGNNRVREIIAKTSVIITVAGNGTAGYTGDGGPGASAELNAPAGVAVDVSGNVYIADSNNNVVRELFVSTGNIGTIAGNGTGGYAGDSGPATGAELFSPQAVAVDSAKNVYIADTFNSVIRKVTAATGVITTVAGSANYGYSGDNGPATSAELFDPEGVAVDGAGNIYIDDAANNRVRKVTVSTGIITTVAGNGSLNFSGDGGQATSAALNYPYGVMVDASKNIYIADTNNNRIRKVTASTGIITTIAGGTSYAGNGGAATSALLAYPEGIRLDTSGDIFIVDTFNQVIREVAASTGLISTVAGNGTLGYSGDGGAATSAQLNDPDDVAIDSSGNLYIADTYNSCIRKVTAATKIITTFAGQCGLDTFQNEFQVGDNGPATSATLWNPNGIALDAAGNLYIADDHNSVVRKVSKANGYITLFAGTYESCSFSGDGGAATSATFCAPYGVALDSSGDVFISDYANNDIREVLASNGTIQTVAGNALEVGSSGDGGPAINALLNQPQGMAIDGGGNLYFADFGNNRIRKIDLSSNLDITTVAGTGIGGFYGDTKAAASAELFWPWSVAVDASANVYIADANNNRIRAVGKPKAVAPAVSWPAPATIAYGTPLSATQLNATATVPGTFSYSPAAGQVLPLGSNTLSVTFTPTDTVDYTTATAQTTISVIQSVPKITWATPAAIPVGTALSATQLNATANTAGTFTYSPAAGVVLAAGTQTLSVNFAPSNTSEYGPATASVQLTVTASATAGIIETFAGTGTGGYNGDNIAATSAELDGPLDVAVDSSGNVYITDQVNARIRKVATTGIITTFAGNGTKGSGSAPTSSGPATSIELGNAVGLGVDTSNNVYYADATFNIIRKITVSTGIMAIVAGNGQLGYSGNGGVATSASLNGPSGVAVDSAGNLYISDTQNDVIRKVAASGGIITTIAGTALKAGYSGDGAAATGATLNLPTGIAVDSSGNVYFADTSNSRVRKITASTGIITTYAGNGTEGASGDGGPASSAGLWSPQGIALDSQGNLFISDSSSMSVREVNATTGIIATVAGTGVWGYNGDGIPATTAELKSPFGVRVASNGNMYIADTVNNRVRVVGASKIAPNFTWATPAPIFYGTALSATQLDASAASIPGTITYSEKVGTVLKAGVYNLSAVFVPSSSNYSIETAEVLLTVNAAPAPVSWPQPADITNGAALSATQLDATSTIPGSFVYSPAAGTVLTQGPHLLSVTFTPTDTVDYVPTTVTVAITVSGGTTTYDTGTVKFLANGTPLGTVSYGQNSTPATVTAALATAVNGSGSPPVTLKAVDNTLYITAVTAGAAGDSISYEVENTAYNTAFSGPSFPSATISGTLEGGGASGTDSSSPVYSYNDGYDGVGNVTSSTDSVMGNWTFTPDSLNRLVGATNVPVPVSTSSTSYYCWSYDAFGNRNLQGVSSATFSSPAPACTPAESASYQGVWAHYAAGNNRLSNTQQAIGGVSYDGAGNILNDGVNQYLYDGEGRICAVSSGGTGAPVLTGYIYNAEGERVSKGSITAWSCDPGVNGFKPLSDYVVGLSGEQVTEMGMNPSGSMAWQHTNVYAFGHVMATYDNDGLHFYLNDPLGTRRAQTDYAGVLEQTCASLPFGDGLNCTNSTQSPTEQHFTGKERDAESGNDYFGARYYGSSMGRFMSPDPSNLSVDWWLPQTWNRYTYGLNNPLSMVDRNGLWPFWIHNEIYDEAFPGMSKNDLQTVKDASFVMDFGQGQQEPSSAYMHGMSDGSGKVFWGGEGGNAAHDQIAADNYIDSQVQAAQEAQANWIAQGHTGFSPLALSAFGNALHTVTDRTSPAHEGEQPWSNKFWPGAWHVMRELHISNARQTDATNASRALFQRTFGNEFNQVLSKGPCAQTSATDDKGNTTGWSGCQ
jgi:RHS repeat-associated protein